LKISTFLQNNLISGKAAMLLQYSTYNSTLAKSIRDKMRRENHQKRRAGPPNVG
jgi:hypothetical protein